MADKSIVFTYSTADSPHKASTNITNGGPLGCELLCTLAQSHFVLKSESLVQNHPPQANFSFQF